MCRSRIQQQLISVCLGLQRIRIVSFSLTDSSFKEASKFVPPQRISVKRCCEVILELFWYLLQRQQNPPALDTGTHVNMSLCSVFRLLPAGLPPQRLVPGAPCRGRVVQGGTGYCVGLEQGLGGRNGGPVPRPLPRQEPQTCGHLGSLLVSELQDKKRTDTLLHWRILGDSPGLIRYWSLFLGHLSCYWSLTSLGRTLCRILSVIRGEDDGRLTSGWRTNTGCETVRVISRKIRHWSWSHCRCLCRCFHPGWRPTKYSSTAFCIFWYSDFFLNTCKYATFPQILFKEFSTQYFLW